MDNPRINFRYATALFGLARENDAIEQANADMAALADVCLQNRDLQAMLQSPVIMADKKIAVMRQIFGSSLGKISMAFIEIIIRKRREAHLNNIAQEFGNLYREYRNIKQAVVTTISPLTDSMRSELLDILSKQTGSTIELKEKIDPSIIGGMIVKLEGIQFDDSLRKKIQSLRTEFNVNNYIKGF